MQLLKKEDSTFDEDTMSAEAKWSYYTASFIKIEPTEGVALDGSFNMPFLRRNMPRDIEDADEASRAVPHAYENGLELRICVNSYKILYEPHTQDWFLQSDDSLAEDERASAPDLARAREQRQAKFEEDVVMTNTWIKAATQEQIVRKKAAFAHKVGTPVETELGVGQAAETVGDQDTTAA